MSSCSARGVLLRHHPRHVPTHTRGGDDRSELHRVERRDRQTPLADRRGDCGDRGAARGDLEGLRECALADDA